VSAAITRLAIPASPQGIDRRERVLCAIAIVAGVVLASVSTEPRHRPLLLFLPGALGVVHALAAGPPTRDALWSGRVGPRRRAVCLALPAVVLSGALALFVGVLALSAWSARSR
jgi:hypothetical protein